MTQPAFIPQFLELKTPQDTDIGGGHVLKASDQDFNFILNGMHSGFEMVEFIKKYMRLNGRILRFYGTQDTELDMLLDCARVLRPWQIRVVRQQDGSFEFNWTCIGEWILNGKYGKV